MPPRKEPRISDAVLYQFLAGREARCRDVLGPADRKTERRRPASVTHARALQNRCRGPDACGPPNMQLPDFEVSATNRQAQRVTKTRAIPATFKATALPVV
jgi:hypothetical protein